MSVPKLQATKNYRLFTRSIDNRPLNPAKHKRLRRSMEQYGFLACYPVVCVRDEQKRLVILDGQHRAAFAEILGLAAYFIVMDESFDIPTINGTQEKWNTRNFAETYAAQGKKTYQEGLEFADRHGLPVGTAFGLLAGTASWNNVAAEYYRGGFRIRDREWADTVGTIYSRMVECDRQVRSARFLEACMAASRVEGFDSQRLLANTKRCREKLMSYSTRDAYLEMLEGIYNYGRKQLVPLKLAAIQTMRERSAVKGNGKPPRGV